MRLQAGLALESQNCVLDICSNDYSRFVICFSIFCTHDAFPAPKCSGFEIQAISSPEFRSPFITVESILFLSYQIGRWELMVEMSNAMISLWVYWLSRWLIILLILAMFSLMLDACHNNCVQIVGGKGGEHKGRLFPRKHMNLWGLSNNLRLPPLFRENILPIFLEIHDRNSGWISTELQ